MQAWLKMCMVSMLLTSFLITYNTNRLSAYSRLTRRCVSASVLPRACLHIQMFPVISGRLCLETAALSLVRNVGRSLFSMNIHVSGDFQIDKQGFVTSKGQWGGEGGVRGLCQHGGHTTAKYEWSQTQGSSKTTQGLLLSFGNSTDHPRG